MLQSPKLLDSNWGLWNPRSKVQWHEIAIYWKRFETSVFCTKTAHSHWFWIIVYFLMWYISAFIVVFWTDLRTRIIASFLALLHSFNLTILRLCLLVKVSKPIVGLLNAHNCMGSCMLVKLLPPRVIHHCRVHNWVQAQVVSFASKCFQAWLHYFYYDAVSDLMHNWVAQRPDFKSALRVVKMVLNPQYYLYLWPIMWFPTQKIEIVYFTMQIRLLSSEITKKILRT